MAGGAMLHRPFCPTGKAYVAGQPSLGHCCYRPSKHSIGRSLSHLCKAKGQSYHVEVEVSEDEDPEGVLKRFRNNCNLSGMVYEARRRQHFENFQDIKKRKQQEKGLRKMRDMRERFMQTYEEAHSDTPPFVDLFQGDDDLYDVDGELSLDNRESRFQNGAGVNGNAPSEVQDGSSSEAESPSQPQAAQSSELAAQPRAAPAAQPKAAPRSESNGYVRGSENITRRSVPSQAPQPVAEQSDAAASSKSKTQVVTARTRRANKAKGQAPAPQGAANQKPASGSAAPQSNSSGAPAKGKKRSKGKGSGGKK